MIDTHSHILPGIDDGASTLEDAVTLCRIAADDGVTTTVCTPHINFRYANRRATIEDAFNRLSGALGEAGVPLKLVKGAEVHHAPDIVEKLKGGDLVTYNDGRCYLLLEFPFQQVMTGDEDIVYRLRLAGVTPVIAHPERIAYFMEDVGRLHRLVQLGALVQITGGSVLGKFGERSQRASLAMLERRLVHVLASDAHDASYRRPVLAEAAEAVARDFGEACRRALVFDHPLAIVEGRTIEAPDPVEPRRRSGGILGIFRRDRQRGGS